MHQQDLPLHGRLFTWLQQTHFPLDNSLDAIQHILRHQVVYGTIHFIS